MNGMKTQRNWRPFFDFNLGRYIKKKGETRNRKVGYFKRELIANLNSGLNVELKKRKLLPMIKGDVFHS